MANGNADEDEGGADESGEDEDGDGNEECGGKGFIIFCGHVFRIVNRDGRRQGWKLVKPYKKAVEPAVFLQNFVVILFDRIDIWGSNTRIGIYIL